jgi:hypothetical protein
VILSRRKLRAIVALFILAALLAATSILFTVGYVNHQNNHQAAAAAKAAKPLCGALLHLSMIKGSHGDSGATYGQNLEKAFEQVYAATDCPQIMKEK